MKKDRYLLKKIQDLLSQEPELQPFLNYLKLNVTNGKLIVNGWVPNAFLRDRILQLISMTPEVTLLGENLKVEQPHRVEISFDWKSGRMALS